MDDEELKSRHGRSAIGVELAILRMSQRLGSSTEFEGEPGWWVLAVGAQLDEEDFGSRERARERLRLKLEKAGIRLPEYIWVWDDAGRAQVVLATLRNEDYAARIARRVELKGIETRVAREFE